MAMECSRACGRASKAVCPEKQKGGLSSARMLVKLGEHLAPEPTAAAETPATPESATTATAAVTTAATETGPAGKLRLRLARGQEAFALGALARELAGAAHRFRLFAGAASQAFDVVAAQLHLAEDALTLHFLLERFEGLIDVVVAYKNLHEPAAPSFLHWGDGKGEVPSRDGRCYQKPRKLSTSWLLGPITAASTASFRPHLRYVSHLPPEASFALTVEMDSAAGGGGWGARHLVADQVCHLDLAEAAGVGERPAGNRAQVLLELAHARGVEGPMAGVVHARGELVHQEPIVAGDEHLDRDHTHIAERVSDLLRHRDRLFGELRRDRRRHAGVMQDGIGVIVLDGLIGDDLAGASARGDHGNLADEIDEALQDRRFRAHRAPSRGGFAQRADCRLALAVVAEMAGF